MIWTELAAVSMVKMSDSIYINILEVQQKELTDELDMEYEKRRRTKMTARFVAWATG